MAESSAGSLVQLFNVSSVSCYATLFFPYSKSDRHAMLEIANRFFNLRSLVGADYV